MLAAARTAKTRSVYFIDGIFSAIVRGQIIYSSPADQAAGKFHLHDPLLSLLHSSVLIMCIMSFFTYSIAGARESFWTLVLKYSAPRRKWRVESVTVN